jgi:plasmid stabilization system protein ParE
LTSCTLSESNSEVLSFADLIEEDVGTCANPEIGRRGRAPGTRELVISQTPFLVAYRVHNETIEVLRVLHGAQRWPDRL